MREILSRVSMSIILLVIRDKLCLLRVLLLIISIRTMNFAMREHDIL